MKILFQPTTQSPRAWQQCDASEWAQQGDFLVAALNVQGVSFVGPDGYGVEAHNDGSVTVYAIHDDANDWPEGQKWVRVVSFLPLGPDPRPEYGGAINTNINQVVYAQDGIRPHFARVYAENPRVLVLPWSPTLLTHPAVRTTRRGKWVSDEHWDRLTKARSVRGWREWSEHLSAEEAPGGVLRGQRAAGRWVRPLGTRTYYHRDTDRAAGAYSAQHENAFENGTGSPANETAINVTIGEQIFGAATPAGEPDSSAWPTTGVYRYQLDCIAVDGDSAFGLRTLDGAAGYFGRVSSDLATLHQSFQQSQAAFTSSGLHLASVTNPAWSSGSASDRFVIVIAHYRTAGHTKQALTLQLNETDDYADGPWAAAAPPTDHTIFFGCNF